MFLVPCCAVRSDFRIETMLGSSLPPVVLGGFMSCLCLFAYSGIQHIVMCVCLVCLRLVYPMLPVSLGCPLLIAPSVFSYNVYLFQ